MIPYYAWAHRGTGEMSVWLANDLSVIRPVKEPTIASKSTIDASHNVKSISAINDRLVPKDEHDRSVPYYHWWPKQNSTEWISYEFDEEKTVSSASVTWFDDGPWGGCRVPDSWKVYYKIGSGDWIPVENKDDYSTVKGFSNSVSFIPVKTTAVKLEIVLPKEYASGVFEWEIE